jgi:hypothetical protein
LPRLLGSSGPLTASPPAEDTTARQNQTRQSSADDGAGGEAGTGQARVRVLNSSQQVVNRASVADDSPVQVFRFLPHLIRGPAQKSRNFR